MGIKLTESQKARITKDLIKVGAVPREKPLTPSDSYYSKSIGEVNKAPIKVRI